MMTQPLQGKSLRYAPSNYPAAQQQIPQSNYSAAQQQIPQSNYLAAQQQIPQNNFPVQQQILQGDHEMLQLDNIRLPTSSTRLFMIRNIEAYLKGTQMFCTCTPDLLLKISTKVEEELIKNSRTKTEYCDLSTLQVRVKAAVIKSRINSKVLPPQNLHQNGVPVPDHSIYHGRIGPAFTDPLSCARDVFTGSVFTSERYAQTDHNMAGANLALAGTPEVFTNTIFAPCVLASPQCSSGLGGIVSAELYNGHITDHFPGAHQIGSPQPSMSGSSSPLSAVCDPTTSSSMVIRSSVDSISESNAQNLSTGRNVNSIIQEQSRQLYGEYEKDFDCTWNQPFEQSNLSNVTTQSHGMLYVGDYTKKRLYPKGEHGVDIYMGMKEKYWQITDSGSYDLPREAVERSEQISNSTVLMPASPISDESSVKHRPAKRLKSDLPNPAHFNHAGSPEEQKPIINGTHISRETIKLENPDLPTKSPCCSSMEDSNADTNKMLESGSEDVHNVEAVRSPETRVSGETVQSENKEFPTKSSCCSSMGESCGNTDKVLEPGSEDVHRMETFKSQESCAQREEKLDSANGDIMVKECEAVAPDQTPRGVINSKKRRGASILYTLTAEELRNHMRSLNQHTCLNKVSSEEFQSTEGLPDQNTCNLCGMERLLFEPPPRFCGLCLKMISSTGCYYVAVENGVDKISICSKCHHLSSSKAKYDKRFNYAETDAEAEWWVQCDKCKAWQHQVCALFNQKVVDEEAEYSCAKCFLKEKDNGDISALESSTVLGACELPRTKLSDHVEKRLAMRLQWDRQQRAIAAGKGFEEVPGVEGLTVRVVSSADRVLQVLPRFQEFFKEEKYPHNFPYKSKAILLFQKIDGVDVCLFAMYVQEYGSNCPSPNQRHVYLAYIDSVKYFRPEIKSASGEALRTFVYHEILIGYLDYCKKRGFVSCSIWACPSTKRDDYVLYCHPTAQKMPKSDKLRSWYQNMIKKAVKEGVVVERSTLYDFFLQPTNECKANISAACLPYCENDFWPGEAEKLLEKKDDNTSQKKETQVGRLLRVAKRDDRKGNLEDMLLVHRLGEKMRSTKEDFIMLCLQQFCKHCHQPTVSGKSWVCTSCKNFHLCDKCHAEEQNIALKDRHPTSTKQIHIFQRIAVEPLPQTDDGDPTVESKYFDSRIDFLKHCQDNQYQFDTLRRAKHSTMMILYLLHDSACSACHQGMDQSLAWRCQVCLGFSFCDACYKQSSESLHIHELRQTDYNKSLQKITQRDYFEGLVHASRCFDPRNCSSRICLPLKRLFIHGVRCNIHVRNWGGCQKCVFMWKLLLSHAIYCNQDDCMVPRCRDIKVYLIENKFALPVGKTAHHKSGSCLK